MLNREKIIKEFNRLNNKKLCVDSEDIIDAFVDLAMDGVTDEMVMQGLERGAIDSRELLFDSQYIKGIYEPTPADDVPTPTDSNPFGFFEQAIEQVVANKANPIVKKIVDAALEKWYADNPNKVNIPVTFTAPNGNEMQDVTHEMFETIVKCVGHKKSLMLVGPTGTGKSHIVEQVAKFLDLPFYFTGAVVEEYSLLGYNDANGNYHSTQFHEWTVNGGVFLFDEFDASDENAVLKFNQALSNGYCDFPCGRVDLNPDCVVIATANTWGTGASYEYNGRNKLDDSTTDRFGTIYIDYSPRIESAMTDDLSLLEFIHTFRKACIDGGIHKAVSYRAIANLHEMVEDIGVEQALRTFLIKGMERDDINTVIESYVGCNSRWADGLRAVARG